MVSLRFLSSIEMTAVFFDNLIVPYDFWDIQPPERGRVLRQTGLFINASLYRGQPLPFLGDSRFPSLGTASSLLWGQLISCTGNNRYSPIRIIPDSNLRYSLLFTVFNHSCFCDISRSSIRLVVLAMAGLRFAPIHIIESATLDNNYAGHIYYPHLNALGAV